VTFITHRTLPSAGMIPCVTPFLGRHICEVADAVIEAW
jgi:hypothetical protein